jgi:hypothetical protein
MSRLTAERQVISAARLAAESRVVALQEELTARAAEVVDHNTEKAEVIVLQTAIQTA